MGNLRLYHTYEDGVDNMQVEGIETIIEKVRDKKEPEWDLIVHNHYRFGIELLRTHAETDERFYHDVIFHMNCIVEGAVKLIIKKVGKTNKIKGTLGALARQLARTHKSLPSKMDERLEEYITNIRNVYTHDVFVVPSKEQAVGAVIEATLLAFLLKNIYSIPDSIPITDHLLCDALLNAFLESFGLAYGFGLYEIDSRGYIQPEGMAKLADLLVQFSEDSIFSEYFVLEKKQVSNYQGLLSSDFSEIITSGDQRFLKIEKLGQNLTYVTFPTQFEERMTRLKRKFPNVTCFVIIFGIRWRTEVCLAILDSLSIPYFALYVVNPKKERKDKTLDEFLVNQ